MTLREEIDMMIDRGLTKTEIRFYIDAVFYNYFKDRKKKWKN